MQKVDWQAPIVWTGGITDTGRRGFQCFSSWVQSQQDTLSFKFLKCLSVHSRVEFPFCALFGFR